MESSSERRVPAASVGAGEPANRWRVRDIPYVVVGNRAVALVVACVVGLIAAQIAISFPPRVAGALFACLVGGLVVMLEPFVGIIGYIVLAFLRPQDVFWGLGQERLNMLVSGATLGATLLHFSRRPRLAFLASWQNLFLATLLLSIYLSTQFGRFGQEEPRWMGYYYKFLVTYLAFLAVINTKRKLQVATVAIALSLGYLCYWANEQYFFAGVYQIHGPGYEGSTFYDNNDFAMVMAMTIPLLWFMHRWTTSRLLKLLLLGIIPLAVHGVMLTYSRGGFLGMVAGFGVIVVRERSRRLAAAIVVGGVAFFALFTGQSYHDRLLSIGGYEEDASAQSRINSWEAGRAMITDNPIFGVGLKQYTRAFPYYSSKEVFVAHNSWLQLATECGLLALGSWAMLILLSGVAIVRVWRRAHKLPEEAQKGALALASAFGGALVVYLVCGFFLSAEDLELFYVLVALTQILDRLTAETVREGAVLRARPAVA